MYALKRTKFGMKRVFECESDCVVQIDYNEWLLSSRVLCTDLNGKVSDQTAYHFSLFRALTELSTLEEPAELMVKAFCRLCEFSQANLGLHCLGKTGFCLA